MVLRWLRPGLILLLALHCGAQAATPTRSLRFEHLGVEQGLVQESVLNVLQDRQGFMWFGSQAGLSRFDGYRLTLFKNVPSDPFSLADNYVSASFEDAQGRLWFGTKGGLTRFDRERQQFIAVPIGAPPGASRQVTAITSDGGKGLWLATNDGLKHLDPDSGSIDTLHHIAGDAASLSDERVTALARDAQGALWVGTVNGLNRLAPGARQFQHLPNGAPDDARASAVLALSVGPDHTLWVGSGAGLDAWQLDGTVPRRRHLGPEQGMSAARILCLHHDRDGDLWVGSEADGLLWRDRASGRFRAFRHQALDQHSLSDNQTAAILVDRNGTLWVGSWYNGVDRTDLASGGFDRYIDNAGEPGTLSSNKIRVVAGAGSDRLWLGTTGGGLDLLDLASGTSIALRHDPNRPDSLPDDVITALEPDGARLWVGSPSGLSSMDTASKRFTRIAPLPGASANYIQRLLKARDDGLWVLTRGGLFLLDQAGHLRRSWQHDARDPASLGDNHGFALLEERNGALWVGTDGGLDRLDPASGRFAHFRHTPGQADSLRHSRVYALTQTARGALWVGTAGGLQRIDQTGGGTRFRDFPLHEGAANPIGAVLEDKAGMLWVSSTAGIARLDPASGAVRNYTAKDGLVDGSYFVGSAYAAPDGRFSFGGVNGLTSFQPGAIRSNPHPPVVLITDFQVFNQSLRPGQELGGVPFKGPIQDMRALTLSHRDSVFSFEFAALHFGDPQRNRYAYRLAGFDRDWVATDAGRRFATYTNLDPGNYVFQVRASNQDGVWSATPTSLEITITPPFWKTWWFRLLAAALVLGTAYALPRVRIRALVQQKSLLEQQVGARTAELLLQKESVERQKREVEHQKEVVEHAHRDISLLSEIGRKITAKLDSEAIMLMLYDQVNQLMDASVFGIGIYRPEQALIEYPFAIERGKRYAPYVRSMREPNQLAVWCIEHEREVFINDLEAEYERYIADLSLTSGAEHMGTLDDGSLPTEPRSLLYVPISVNGRVLGVVTVHSYRAQAYGQIHLDMLRTLAAYVGVAFDNADAYRLLKTTQAQLVAQEKLAALGSLVAGVAHELNTPIGNSLLMASALQERTDAIAVRFEAQEIRRSDLGGFIGAAQEASGLIMRSLFAAADLVNSFKQVAVDQASAQRRRFNLDQASHEIVATMMNQVRKAGHTLELAIPNTIVMDSYPGPYGQVIINFVNNSLLHAFERPGGRITLTASTPEPGRVQIVYRDDGVGIAPEHQARIFDPFFTTKMGQGGSGLGLNITYNIVTSLLAGRIRVISDGGTTFILDLPLAVTE